MKKYFLSIVALAGMLFATSCQESLVEPQVGGTTTFTVQVPDQMGTKAIGGHDLVNKLYVEVYAQGATGNVIFETTADKKQDGSFEVSMNLIQDQHYSIIFWAQKEGAYIVENLRSIPMNVNHPNNESGAAFFAYLNDFVPTGTSQTVTLKRPFAQLNLGTTEGSLNTDAGNFELSQSEISVKGVAESFNTVLGYGEGSKDVYFELKNVPAEVLKVADNEYKYISMNYLPVAGDNKALVEVKAKVTVKDEQNNTQDIYHVFTSVPVQENYRTNIVGNLISSSTDFNVIVDAEFDGELPQTAVDKLRMAAQVGGEFTLTEDISLTQPLEVKANMILDLNGKTINVDFVEGSTTNHIYAFENHANLTIKGNGTINARGIFNYGVLTLENGTINAIDGNGGYAVKNYEGSTFIMNGGTLATTTEDDHLVDKGGYDATALRVDEGATATINGGTINNICDFTVAIDNYGETEINGGTITSVHTTVANEANEATMTINGGTFTCNGIEGITAHVLWADGGTVKINGGTFNGKDNYNGFNVNASAGSSVIIEGGEFLPVHSGSLYGDGTITVSGGTFFDNPSAARLADGYKVITKDGKYYVVENDVDIVIEESSDIKDLLKDAINNNDTDILVDAAGNNIGALSYTLNQTLVPAGTTVTIKNATVEGKSYGNGANGDVIFENCVFTNSGAYSIHFDSGSGNVTFKNCILYGWNSFGASLNSVSFYNSELYGNGTYALIRSYANLYLENCYFDIRNANSEDVYSEGVEVISPAQMEEINCEWVVANQEQLVKALETSDKVNLVKGNYTFPTSSIKEGQTIICEEGTIFEGTSSLNIKGSTVIGATFKNEDGVAASGTIHGTFTNCEFIGSEALRWCYSEQGKPVVFEDCVIKTDFRGFHFDGMEGDVTFKGCEIAGFNAFGGEGTITFEDCTFTNDESSYNGLNIYTNTNIKDCTFKFISGKTNFIDMEGTSKTLTIENSSATLDGNTANIADFVGGSKLEQNTVIYK